MIVSRDSSRWTQLRLPRRSTWPTCRSTATRIQPTNTLKPLQLEDIFCPEWRMSAWIEFYLELLNRQRSHIYLSYIELISTEYFGAIELRLRPSVIYLSYHYTCPLCLVTPSLCLCHDKRIIFSCVQQTIISDISHLPTHSKTGLSAAPTENNRLELWQLSKFHLNMK